MRRITVDTNETSELKPLTLAKLFGIIIDKRKTDDRYYRPLEIHIGNDDIYNYEDEKFRLAPYYINAKLAERYAENPKTNIEWEVTLTHNDLLNIYKATEYADLKLDTRKKNGRRLLGVSSKMINIYDQIEKIVASPIYQPILILGETGTGKELIARAIHAKTCGKFNDGQFASINCAAIPDGLIESELFGHTKGAFTGAYRARKGIFEMGINGIIFLDEIGEIPNHIQAKLLRAINERKYRKVGGEKEIDIHARIIVATNRHIDDPEERANPKNSEHTMFRDDLYYRISHHIIRIPTLRERVTDLPLLIDHFSYANPDFATFSLDPIFFIYYLLYSWPGNVRELQTTIDGFIAHNHNYIVKKRMDEYLLVLEDQLPKPLSDDGRKELEHILEEAEKNESKEIPDSLKLMKSIEKVLSDLYNDYIATSEFKIKKARIQKIYDYGKQKKKHAMRQSLAEALNNNVPEFIQGEVTREFENYSKLEIYWEKVLSETEKYIALGAELDFEHQLYNLSKFNLVIYVNELDKGAKSNLWSIVSTWMNRDKDQEENLKQYPDAAQPPPVRFQAALDYFKFNVYWPNILDKYSGMSVEKIHKKTGASQKTIRDAKRITKE